MNVLVQRSLFALFVTLAAACSADSVFGVSESGDWNAGTCCGAAARENVDDVGFLKAVIDRVSKQLPVDQKRIYIAGFSDGGRMAYHAACQLSSTIAAIGVVSGSLLDDHCSPAKS